jgi:hypothetical protein
MKRDRRAFGIALLLFVGWLGWLGWKAIRANSPPIVSAAQLAVAQYDVECDLSGEVPAAEIVIKSVRWSIDERAPQGRVQVSNLAQAAGYVGRGTYLVPLVRRGEGFWVAGLPYDPVSRANPGADGPRIYPLSLAVLQQWRELRGIEADQSKQ